MVHDPQKFEKKRTQDRLDNDINVIDPQTRAKQAVVDYWNDSEYDSISDVTIDRVYVYFFGYILGGWKCYLSSDAWDDTSIFEVTYNIDKEEMYLDHYRKIRNVRISDDSDFKIAKLRARLNREKN